MARNDYVIIFFSSMGRLAGSYSTSTGRVRYRTVLNSSSDLLSPITILLFAVSSNAKA